MAKEVHYCPNCVSEMQEEKRKLGKVKKWLKCPSCGVREEIENEHLGAIQRNDAAEDQYINDEYESDSID